MFADLLDRSRLILKQAMEEFRPFTTVAMFSGGQDSMTALQVARESDIKIDAIVHVNTRCGIPETTEFVREYSQSTGIAYLEADAGSAYEEYVDRKGFWGRGVQAHALAYQILKATPLRKLISREFRHGKRGRSVLLLNGVREDESENRKRNYSGSWYDIDSGARNNIWINHIWHFSKPACHELCRSRALPVNPVVAAIHRSAECMCGTMQNEEDRILATILYPEWGSWLRDLEERAVEKHGWGWGEEMPEYIHAIKHGQLVLDGFLPMCQSCRMVQD